MLASASLSHRDVLQQALSRARRRVGCFATAFVTRNSRGAASSVYFDCTADDDEDVQYARRLLERSADSFFELCGSGTDAVIRNRVRSASSGPLLCRFVVAPALDSAHELAGVFVLYNQAGGPEFSPNDAQVAERLARVFAKTVALPRDPLTKLLTQSAFARVIARDRRAASRESAAILYADVDRLGVVNDLWGMAVGDAALAAIGKAIREAAQSVGATACRLGGNRFALHIAACATDRARELAERICTAVSNVRLTVDEQPVPLSVSIGVAECAPSTGLDHAVAAAELACKTAKTSEHRIEVYQDSDASLVRQRDHGVSIERVRAALLEGRYRIFAQPIARLMRGEEARRFEMLVRFIDGDGKPVLPQEFISSATRHQFLPQLDRHIIEHVFGKLREAQTQPGFQPVQVSLNLSAPTIADAEFADWLIDRIRTFGVPSEWLGFELSENAAALQLERAQALIAKVGALGCRFALDDFGVGGHSLTYLKSLKLSSIKIDGSFIRDVMENERAAALVRGIAQLASAMGVEVVAKSAETPTLCMRLIELGVQFGQGFAIGRPLPLECILDPSTALALAS